MKAIHKIAYLNGRIITYNRLKSKTKFTTFRLENEV